MTMMNSRIAALATALAVSASLPVASSFAPHNSLRKNAPSNALSMPRHQSRSSGSSSATALRIQTPGSLEELPSSVLSMMSTIDTQQISDFYAEFPLQAAVLTCGIKAHVADGIAQVRSSYSKNRMPRIDTDDLEFRRNLAYIIYGGIFVGMMCHLEYDVIFPRLFGREHSLATSVKEVLFDNFVSAPLLWLPPAYIIKSLLYDSPVQEGLLSYYEDVKYKNLLTKYWTIWVPAQSISFTVVPDHLRVVFMAAISFFWFILLSTLSASSEGGPITEGRQQE
mmetsp:Transcript_9898/g.21361  ORF Transcript_9898/g.21361 Transcript_9898/m.21361 type:complete len:281 (-) Transcript_9898:173-1015(-)